MFRNLSSTFTRACVAALIVLTPALTGCGDGSDPTPTQTPTVASAATAPAAQEATDVYLAKGYLGELSSDPDNAVPDCGTSQKTEVIINGTIEVDGTLITASNNDDTLLLEFNPTNDTKFGGWVNDSLPFIVPGYPVEAGDDSTYDGGSIAITPANFGLDGLESIESVALCGGGM